VTAPEPVYPTDIDRTSKAEPRALGCGAAPPGVTSGRYCAGTGTELSCLLCPQSPNYWNREH
jgi:hypothetical protein